MSDIFGARRTAHPGHGWRRCAVAGCEEHGSPSRHGHPGYCLHHTCKKTNCGGAKIDGSAYCLKHACDLTTCSRSRLDTSAYCNQHACQYSGCVASKRGAMTLEGVSSEACDDHICQSEECAHPRRYRRPFCKEHACGWAGRVACNQEVEVGSKACRDHVCQFEGGCSNIRKVKTNSQACDDHTCRIAGCYKSVGVRGKFCRDHTCIWEPCSQRGGYGGSPYCDTHKCGTSKCSAPVQSKLDWFCTEHKCRYEGGTCSGGWKKFPPFCEDHTCSIKDCDEPIRWNMEVCLGHIGQQVPKKPASNAGSKKESKPARPKPYIEENEPGDDRSVVSYRDNKNGSRHNSPRSKSGRSEVSGPIARREDVFMSSLVRNDLVKYALDRQAGLKPELPEVLRKDPDYALAYGCGMQDAFYTMMENMKGRMDFPQGGFQNGPFPQGAFPQTHQAPNPMGRNMPEFVGPRVTEQEEI